MKKLLLLLGVMLGISFGAPALVDNYYQLNSKEDLEWFRDKVNASTNNVNLNAKLLVDIDFENQMWIPIAAGTGSPRFNGVFDGGGHTISNYYIDSDSLGKIKAQYKQNIGFVGALSGTIKNINLSNITVTSITVGNTVPNANTGTIESKAICIGTIVGWMEKTGKIDSTSATGTLNGFGNGQNVGGIAGNIWGTIKNSRSAVTINVKNLSFVGGIVGMTKNNIKIDNVLWEGNINVIEKGSEVYIGGIIGDIYEGTATISNATFISDNVTNSVGKTCATCKLTADKLDYGVYSILFNNNKKTLVLNGDYTKSMSDTVFDKSITVDNFTFNRKFKKGVYSTISLPITIPVENVSGATFYELIDVEKDTNNKWQVRIDTLREENLIAGVPYIVITDGERIEFNANSYTFSPIAPQTVYSTTHEWSLNTVHKFTLGAAFGEDRKNVYGFAGKSVDGIKAGQFVHAGEKASFKPFRVYLHKETKSALLKARQYNPAPVANDSVDYDIPIVIGPRPNDTTLVEVSPVTKPDTIFEIKQDSIVEPQTEIDSLEVPMVIRKQMQINVYKPVKKIYYNLLGRRLYEM
jgi:hypothetical protein